MNGQFSIGDLRPTRYFLAIAVILGLLFASVAPESGSTWLEQTLQWQVQTVIPMLLCIAVHILLARFSQRAFSNPWFKLFLSGLTASAIFSPIALMSDVFLAKEALESSPLTEIADEFFSIAPPITLCWMAINAPFQLGFQLTQSSKNTKPKFKPLRARFIELIPEDKKGDLIYLKSELHYLLVVTDRAESLILYSLKNAISELPPNRGMQIHRSYWVDTSMINSLEKNGREGTLLMKNGDSLPVSRRYLKVLSEKLAQLTQNN